MELLKRQNLNRYFLNQMPRNYNLILNIVAITLLMYIGVDIFYRVVRNHFNPVHKNLVALEPPDRIAPRKAIPFSSFNTIMQRNLFGAKEDISQTDKLEKLDKLEETSLNIALLGTVAGKEKTAYAVIEEKNNGKQGLYKVGDSIQNAIIKLILRGKVVLSWGGNDEILTMEESSSSKDKKMPQSRKNRSRFPPVRSSNITVNRTELEESLNDISSLMTQARIRPHLKKGRPDGFSVSRIKSGSIFLKLGIKNGDVIKKINGNAIRESDDVMLLYEQITSSDDVSVDIERRGRVKTLNYNFR